MNLITPVLLAGGAGTRLWPLSRQSFPKQFAPLLSGESLFTASVRRFQAPGFAPPLVLTGRDFRFIATEQLSSAGASDASLLVEPEGRNTAPAILAAALWLRERAPNSLMLVAPCDHAIPDSAAFRAAVDRARPAAEAGQLVTFGVTPTRAETGYGYIALSNPGQQDEVQKVLNFVEKPDLETAQRMLDTGGHLWNAGIFLFSSEVLISAFEQHAPEMIAPVTSAVDRASYDLGFHRLESASWRAAPNISIDHAIMERANNISTVPYNDGWSDLGDWDSVAREMDCDTKGNAARGQTTLIDCVESLLRTEEDGPELVGLGLENMLVVAMRDAVLVADRSRAQDVKHVVTALRARSTPQADSFAWDHRPWGRFETLAAGSRFQVKRIVVKPGGILSLQSHVHRAEHWIMVEGTARVTIGDEVQLLSENQSVYVPLGQTHRLENPGKLNVVLIEVQTGSYLGEDDITRYEDVYARSIGPKG